MGCRKDGEHTIGEYLPITPGDGLELLREQAQTSWHVDLRLKEKKNQVLREVAAAREWLGVLTTTSRKIGPWELNSPLRKFYSFSFHLWLHLWKADYRYFWARDVLHTHELSKGFLQSQIIKNKNALKIKSKIIIILIKEKSLRQEECHVLPRLNFSRSCNLAGVWLKICYSLIWGIQITLSIPW